MQKPWEAMLYIEGEFPKRNIKNEKNKYTFPSNERVVVKDCNKKTFSADLTYFPCRCIHFLPLRGFFPKPHRNPFIDSIPACDKSSARPARNAYYQRNGNITARPVHFNDARRGQLFCSSNCNDDYILREFLPSSLAASIKRCSWHDVLSLDHSLSPCSTTLQSLLDKRQVRGARSFTAPFKTINPIRKRA